MVWTLIEFLMLSMIQNIETAIKACKEGGHAQGCFSYTISPVHSRTLVKDAKQLAEMGADSICIKICQVYSHPT